MIIRVFRARPQPGQEEAFERFLRESGLPGVETQAGCSHVAWGRNRWANHPEFVVVTHWDSIGAIEAYAGPEWQQAVVYPEAEAMLAEVFCDHYETVATP